MLEAVVSLFERDYWDRLWVVQEVFNAKQIIVYCGSTKLPWNIYRSASKFFKINKQYLESSTLDRPVAGNRTVVPQKQLRCPQVLAYEGPGSLFDRQKLEFHDADRARRTKLLEDFCLTISLGHGSTKGQDSNKWMKICHDDFATLINYRLPELALDHELASHITSNLSVSDYYDRRRFLQDDFSSRMMGRCFCITSEDLMGLGSGFMTNDDIVVVPVGCSTPIILRQEGDEFRYVGDVFIRGYMYGKAVYDYKDGKRPLRQYVLH
ncbi:hypothetical protein VP1G_11337 [Cytospora mali]|uniref:Heterokaryon incompatibility domain-containing protein n=1 Tax=Cytospora mali TaxID=578113 RepID=A0A194VBG8_CYTMA|nr:hypothetical protein VP1G_11337 [Valsa mali var. pyri (nom. inval.)]